MPRPRHAAHRVTTAHLQALYPWVAEGGLGSSGVYVGRDRFGGAFCYDPWELYDRGELTGPNMLVIGQLGRGKSAFAKTYASRQLVFGRRSAILDPKGEWEPVARAAGGAAIRLMPHGNVRLNPLDTGVGTGRPAAVVLQGQVGVVCAVLGASLDRMLTPEERVAVEVALATTGASTSGQTTLPGVVDALLNPSDEAARSVHTERDALRLASREVGVELRRLVRGDLAGMFDGPTSGSVDLDAPVVVFDLSAVYHSDALGILMVCVAAWLQRALARTDGSHRIVVLDEAWALLRHRAIVRFLQSSWKLARSYGVQNIAVLHRLSDLAAAGGADTEEVRLAQGLLSDSETRVIYGQPPGEVEKARELLGLTDTEAEVITRLPRGVALWKVGQRSFLVEHRLGAGERALVDTDARMTARIVA